MADVALTPQAVNRTGVVASYTSVVSGNTYFVQNGPSTILHFRYTGVGTAIITMVTPRTIDGLAVADASVTLAASTQRFAVAQPLGAFNDSQGRLAFTVNTASGLDVAVLQAA